MHVPVLLRETVESLAVRPGGVYVDGTLGRAGHACAVLARAGNRATLVGIDRDEQALRESAERLKAVAGARVELVHGRHGDLAALVRERGIDEVDGILLDLGVSSPQLDEAGRGFSFRSDGPLDMRMDRSRGLTAADLIATKDEDALAATFRTLGEEPQARRVARALVRAREKAPRGSSRTWWSGRWGATGRTTPRRASSRRCAWRSTTRWANWSGRSRAGSTC